MDTLPPLAASAEPVASVGVSFTAVRVTVTVAAAEDSAPSDAVTVKVLAPFSFAAGS